MSSIRAAKYKHSQYYEKALRQHHRLYNGGGNDAIAALQQFDFDWQNIQIGQKWAVDNTKLDRQATILSCYYPDAGAMILDMRQVPTQRI